MTPDVTVGVVTLARHRRDHLDRQFRAMAAQLRKPDRYVVVDLGGDAIEPLAARRGVDARVVPFPTPAALPLAAARNLGHAACDTDITIFLDVDCIPICGLVEAYRDGFAERPAVRCGPVGYLPPLAPGAFWDADGGLDEGHLRSSARFHPGRPRPGEVPRRTDRYELFWSLSFAVERGTWNELGGFDECYVGYGAEDTDLAWTMRSVGVELWFDGAAVAYHQHHPVSSPPIEHLDDICRNSLRFFERWGEWPMTGWLRQFAERGLVVWRPDDGVLERACDAQLA